MKSKTIEKLLIKKFNEFLESIQDERVKNLVKENSIITGGCIASMYLKEKINDYDIYFTNKETVLAVSKYYLDKFNTTNGTNGYIYDADKELQELNNQCKEDAGRVKIIFDSIGVQKEKGLETDEIHELGDTIEIKNDEGEKYRPVYLSSNAITLSTQIQIIIRFYGNPEEIHDNYDFVHCTNYWLSKTEKLNINQKALECLIAKELFYIGSKYPLASIIRLRKFITRGWQINAGQIVKICLQLQHFDLFNPKVLEDQLVGVDLAYFSMLIEALSNREESTTLTYEYISTIIDRVF